MDWFKNISDSKSTYNKLINFLNLYGLLGLEDALQYYEDIQQDYLCKTKTSSTKIKINDIYYLKITGHEITIYAASGRFKKYGTLNDELKVLASFGFIKCNQSYIVSLKKIRTISHNQILLINNDKIPMSRHFAPKVMVAFHNYSQKNNTNNP